jgi:hypothetical protein
LIRAWELFLSRPIFIRRTALIGLTSAVSTGSGRASARRTRRITADRGKHPVYLRSATLGTFYFFLVMEETEFKLEFFSAFFAFIIVDWHLLSPETAILLILRD